MMDFGLRVANLKRHPLSHPLFMVCAEVGIGTGEQGTVVGMA